MRGGRRRCSLSFPTFVRRLSLPTAPAPAHCLPLLSTVPVHCLPLLSAALAHCRLVLSTATARCRPLLFGSIIRCRCPLPPDLCRPPLSVGPDLVAVIGNLNLSHQENAARVCKKRKKIRSCSTMSHIEWQGTTIPVRFESICTAVPNFL
jgi:hypothetical protein